MDRDTGKIHQFNDILELQKEQQKRILIGKNPLEVLNRNPDKNCEKCRGIGYFGRHISGINKGKVIICECCL